MRKFVSALTVAGVAAIMSAEAIDTDVYVVNFRNNASAESQSLDGQVSSAIALSGVNAEEVTIDTSTAALWEKSAHEAFDRDIVPIFNKWVGLPGFVAIVDANTKKVIGCVNSTFSTNEMAAEMRDMASKAKGQAFLSRASTKTKTTTCPAAHNIEP